MACLVVFLSVTGIEPNNERATPVGDPPLDDYWFCRLLMGLDLVIKRQIPTHMKRHSPQTVTSVTRSPCRMVTEARGRKLLG